MKSAGFFLNDDEAVGGSKAKVDWVALPFQPYRVIGRANHAMASLLKKSGKKIGIHAVIKIQVEGHGRPLPA